MIPLRIHHHDLHLLPGRAAWRDSTRTLYIADIHIGKASAFAKGGIPISGEVLERTTTTDLARVTSLITSTSAARLVILGDLLHASAGRDPRTLSLFAAWRAAHPRLEVTLIRGNHDHSAGDPPGDTGIRCIDAPFDDDGLTLLHHPLAEPDGRPTLAGHLHPAIRLSTAGDAARVPCFWFSRAQLVLPAFGAFTGAAAVRPSAGDRVFAVAGECVIEVPVIELPPRPARARHGR